MNDDPLWIDVTELMQQGTSGLGASVTRLSTQPQFSAKVGEYVARLSQLLGITDVGLHIVIGRQRKRHMAPNKYRYCFQSVQATSRHQGAGSAPGSLFKRLISATIMT